LANYDDNATAPISTKASSRVETASATPAAAAGKSAVSACCAVHRGCDSRTATAAARARKT